MNKQSIVSMASGAFESTVAIAKKAAPVSAKAARTMLLARIGQRINTWITNLVVKCMPESVQAKFAEGSKAHSAAMVFLGQLGVITMLSLEERVPENQRALVRAAAHAAGYSSANAFMDVLDFESLLKGIIGERGVQELLETHAQVLADEAAEAAATTGNA